MAASCAQTNMASGFFIQNAGEVRICDHQSIPDKATIKHVIIKQVNGRWYACLILKFPDIHVIHQNAEKCVGVDIGLHHLLVLSDNQVVDNPRWLRGSMAQLRLLQRKASRRQKVSHDQLKSYTTIGRFHEHITNQRRCLHKIATFLIIELSLIAIEELPLAFMNKNEYLSLSSHVAGLGMFQQSLQFKAEEAGARVVAVSPQNT